MSYFFELSFNTKFILVIITITIILDILFQKTVFAISINFVSSLREKIPQENLTIYKTLSHLGKEQIIFPIIYIIYICYPIKYSFLLFNVYFSSKFFVNFLKLSFQSPRPFWNNISVFGKCNNGFGNPSAHAFTTVSIYSSLCHVIINNNNNYILKIILIFFTVLICIITCFCRIILGVHSIDQVIFGSLCGLILYFYFFFVYSEDNIKKEKNYIKEFLICTFLFSAVLLITYLIYKVFYDETLILKMSQLTILYFCPELLLHPSDKSFYLCLTLFGNIGCFYGKIITEYVLDNNISYINKLSEIIKNKKNFWKNNLYIISLGIYFFIIYNFYSYDLFFFLLIEWKKYLINTFLTGILLFGPITILRTLIYEKEGFEEKELIEEDIMKPAEIISNLKDNYNNIQNYEPINV